MADFRQKEFKITVLGRTLEHLGVQMYKHRNIAIAELVANSWDAGASTVRITVPSQSEYDKFSSSIIVLDDGNGMSDDQVQSEYLVVGRNRRNDDETNQPVRPVMGRKGIGKLAGFGIASEMEITTWKNEQATVFTLDVNSLKTEAGKINEVPIMGTIGPISSEMESIAGTKIVLRKLKHNTHIDIDALCESLSRRFSRKVRGEMTIYVNGIPIKEPNIEYVYRYPEDGLDEALMPNGASVSYYYGFTDSYIKTAEARGFTIYVRGKTAQSPPFFFNVEGVASGLHWARYLSGEIEADFLDDGVDDESDLISTDRQEIDWADERTQELREWGEALTKRALREWSERKGRILELKIMEDPKLSPRIKRLEKSAQKQVTRYLKQLGNAETVPEQAHNLADALVRAFEYQHFHDVINQIEDVSEDPAQLYTLLTYFHDWKVLESRAILEIIKGRLEIIEKFHSLIVNNAPETASSKTYDNMHDLIAGYPWLLNAEWQVLAEEKSISTQLRAWNSEDIQDEDKKLRYDFLALNDDKRLVVIEIKRSGHPVDLDELQRLEKYKERLSKGSAKELHSVLICGGNFNVSTSTLKGYQDRDDFETRTWGEIYETTKKYYEHYRAVLEGDIDHPDFARKRVELAKTRSVVESGSVYRTIQERKVGLGPQDLNDDVE